MTIWTWEGEVHTVCAESGDLVSQMSGHQGANGYQGLLDPTQCLGLLSLVTGEPLWC